MAVTLSGVTVSGVTFHAFAPSSLFAAGEQGAWYDPSDFTTMFQDEAGTTPVTAFEQSVGRILDKSGRGNNATTPAAATTSRPVLSARYNLLTKTQEFDDALWVKTNLSVTSTSILDPLGTNTADQLTEASGTISPSLFQSVSTATSVRQSFYVKPNGRTWIYIQITFSGGTSVPIADRRVWFNMSGSGSVGTTGAQYSSATITQSANGWYLVSAIINTSSGGNTGTNTVIGIGNADNSPTYTGDGVSGIYIWGADLRVANDGVGIPPYQRVNTSTSYTTDGFPPYLLFDGVDDYMLTGTITPGINKVQVFAGVRKLSDAAVGVIAEFSTDYSLVSGSFVAYNQSGSGNQGWGYNSRGTVSANSSVTSGYAAPITNILTGLGDISAPSTTVRLNSVQVSQNTGSQGTGNYLAYPLYIGRRGGTTLPFNGRLYSLIVRFGANLTTDQIVQTETWVNSETKAY